MGQMGSEKTKHNTMELLRHKTKLWGNKMHNDKLQSRHNLLTRNSPQRKKITLLSKDTPPITKQTNKRETTDQLAAPQL